MPDLRWTKQQDFCLRLGLLKAIVALLPSNRRSVSSDLLLRRLDNALFRPAWSAAEGLAERASAVLGEPLNKEITCADAALIAANWRSWGQAIKKNTSYKILEWSVSIGLITTGYRITERGLFLYHLIGDQAVEALGRGDLLAYNPFILNLEEQVFFLYHIGGTDELTVRIALEVGRKPVGTLVTTAEAHAITSSCLDSLLRDNERQTTLRSLPKLRGVRELANRIREESMGSRSSGSIASKRPAYSLHKDTRRTTKNADHQAIPRFEQLVDLGLLSKPIDPKRLYKSKTGWTFCVDSSTALFKKTFGDRSVSATEDWRYLDMSTISLITFGRRSELITASDSDAMQAFENAFKEIHRSSGMTPFESIALLVVLRLTRQGIRIEIEHIHRLLLEIKQTGALSSFISFASGNEVERMFVRLRPGFADAYRNSQKPA